MTNPVRLADALELIAAAAAELDDDARASLRADVDEVFRRARQTRLDRRDELVRELIASRYSGSMRRRCVHLAAEWLSHITRRTSDAELRRLTVLSGGKTLGPAQIRNIAEGRRSEFII